MCPVFCLMLQGQEYGFPCCRKNLRKFVTESIELERSKKACICALIILCGWPNRSSKILNNGNLTRSAEVLR